jgi:hypothetical protein
MEWGWNGDGMGMDWGFACLVGVVVMHAENTHACDGSRPPGTHPDTKRQFR